MKTYNICKNYALLTDWISEINVAPMQSLIEYNDSYEKTLGNLWQYRNEDLNDNMTNFQSFKNKLLFTNNTNNADIANEEIDVLLKQLSIFRGLLKCR